MVETNNTWYLASLMKPVKALSYLKKRSKIITSDEWEKLKKQSHSKAFTVANVTKADVLQDIYDSVLKAKSEGWTVKQFQAQLIPALQKKGWYGSKDNTENKQLTKHRLKIILDTNMKTSYSQGQYESKKAISKYRPYWLYTQRDRENKNPAHKKFDGKVFRHDDPIWKKIYPPSQYGCACNVRAISEKELESKNIKVDKGKNYEKVLNDNPKEFQIQTLEEWKPDLSKYGKKLKEHLKDAISQK